MDHYLLEQGLIFSGSSCASYTRQCCMVWKEFMWLVPHLLPIHPLLLPSSFKFRNRNSMLFSFSNFSQGYISRRIKTDKPCSSPQAVLSQCPLDFSGALPCHPWFWTFPTSTPSKFQLFWWEPQVDMVNYKNWTFLLTSLSCSVLVCLADLSNFPERSYLNKFGPRLIILLLTSN